MGLHRYSKLKGVLILQGNNIVNQSIRVTKNIINRLNKNNSLFNIHDCSDCSDILIDKDLILIIKIYYEDMLTKKIIELKE